jgi:hypothetical protein
MYRIPVQLVFAVGTYVFYAIPGKILGLVMIPIGIWTGWKYKITWPWHAALTPSTGMYYDSWYPDMDAPQHSKHSKWFYNAGPFWREYYWRIRNSFSNAMRYTFTNPTPKVDWRKMLDDLDTYTGDGWYYRYHPEKWWYAQYRYSKRTDGDQGWTWYIGWKLDRWDGFGLSVRVPRKNFIPKNQDYGT